MIEALADAIKTLGQTSAIGAGLALLCLASIAGIMLVVALRRVYASEADADSKRRAQESLNAQSALFRADLVAELDKQREREGLIALEMAQVRRANAELTETVAELRVQVALMREQARRMIDLMRDVREGRVAPTALPLPEGM